MPATLKSPYPYFGGKGAVADVLWQRFGRVRNFVDPFFGSGAVLLGRPRPFEGVETVNDINGFLVNFWRAVQADPDAVARYADWPVSELDLHARGDWLFYRDGGKGWVERLRSDPEFYDPKSAGWWVWGASAWIGTGWGAKEGGDGVGERLPHLSDAGTGVHRKLPELSSNRGVNRQLPNLSGGKGVNRQLPSMQSMGVHRKLPTLGHGGTGVHRTSIDGGEPDEDFETSRGAALRQYLRDLCERLRGVRICCGDWSRLTGPSVTIHNGLTAVTLDPPYGEEGRSMTYGEHDDTNVAAACRAWALEWGDNPDMRIALCGYGEHEADMPAAWERYNWKARGGYGNQGQGRGRDNARREMIYFSPHCLKPDQGLFAGLD